MNIEKPLTVHIMGNGEAICGFGVAGEWPADHVYALATDDRPITCAGCLLCSKYPELMDVAAGDRPRVVVMYLKRLAEAFRRDVAVETRFLNADVLITLMQAPGAKQSWPDELLLYSDAQRWL